jgi:membrane-bound lytic murein transglycosylase A
LRREDRPPVAALRPLGGLPGWAAEDHAAALGAFRAACRVSRAAALAAACRAARAADSMDDGAARRFFETWFAAEPLAGEGLLTAYFTPEYAARRAPDAEFRAALRGKPDDLAGGAYAERAEIERRPPERPLAWMRPEDLFFLQTQGSGVVAFEDGRRMKALFAASNGRPFAAIGAAMREAGLLATDEITAGAIHAWLAAHRGPQADALMRLNPRYVFFRLAPDDGTPPTGSAAVPLPAGRALAVDPAHHPMGELLWIEADRPVLKGARAAYRRLAVALDTGGAIRGPVRADLYLGQGPAAGAEAGTVRHALRLYRLVPRAARP